jgi:DHA1 family multidrug resistance protein-like MFS transporter
VLSLFVTSLIIQVATGSIAPILTLYVRDLAGNVSIHRLYQRDDRLGAGHCRADERPAAGQTRGSYRAGKDPHRRADYLCAIADPDVVRSDPAAAGYPAFLLGAADGALLPAVQTLLVYNSTSQISGRIFSYNQSFRDIGNVTGPLIGASVSANYGFRAVFLVTAGGAV